jgi:hypothetical protein
VAESADRLLASFAWEIGDRSLSRGAWNFNGLLKFPRRNLDKSSGSRPAMFEVVRYEHPEIFITSRRTGETYRFRVSEDGTLPNDAASFD